MSLFFFFFVIPLSSHRLPRPPMDHYSDQILTHSVIFLLYNLVISIIMNESQRRNRNVLLYKIYISLILFSKEAHSFVVRLRYRWRHIYSGRELVLALNLLCGGRACQRLHLLASRIVRDDLTTLIGCVSFVRLSILTGL